MQRAFWAVLALGMLACGPDADHGMRRVDPPSEASEGNQPPEIDALELHPAQPSGAESIAVVLRARDLDRDSLRVQYEWYVNDELHDDSGVSSMSPGQFRRGDHVQVLVRVSDGKAVVEQLSPRVLIANTPPRVHLVEITPPQATTTELLKARAEAEDPDGDRIRLQYRWTVNGEQLDDVDHARLGAGRARRGDRVMVEVAAHDGAERGEWRASEPYTMANAPPEIRTQPSFSLSGSQTYRYEVKAKDPDGDEPLSYELLEGPLGMTVDSAAGVVRWDVPESAGGTYDVELAVSDPYGARTLQRYTLQLQWRESDSSGSPAAADLEDDDFDESDFEDDFDETDDF